MSVSSHNPDLSPAFAPTLESPDPGSFPETDRPLMALVTDSSPHLSSETGQLRKQRLRAAALVLFAGLLAFLIKGLFDLDHMATIAHKILFWDHVLITGLIGLIAQRLCSNCPQINRRLWLAELIIFGGSATFFAFVSYTMLTECAAHGFLPGTMSLWLPLIYTYALFIPNSWKRAAIVVGAMALTGCGSLAAAWGTSAEVRDVLATNDHFRDFELRFVMVLAFNCTVAVWGVHTINTLRHEAFAARQMGQYRLKQKIGEGGMGEVYLAEHLLLKRPCAIKLIRSDKTGDGRVLARFEREVRATARLSHWNTVEIFDYGRTDDGTFYYVMEYLPGLNLGQLVDMFGPMPAGRLIHLLVQTCEALREAHQHGLIHRDIKPANVFAAHRGGVFDVAKLLDFGLAKPLSDLSDSHLTQEGTITGSPMYMSPEQATGDGRIDARSDIYSLGVVAYLMLSGRTPFQYQQAIRLMVAHAQETPQPLEELEPSIPRDLADVIQRCLAKNPDERFQDADSLRQALLECEDAGTWTDSDAALWWQRFGCPQKKALDEQVEIAMQTH